MQSECKKCWMSLVAVTLDVAIFVTATLLYGNFVYGSGAMPKGSDIAAACYSGNLKQLIPLV